MKILFAIYKHDHDREGRITKRNYASDYLLCYVPFEKLAKARGHEVCPFWVDEMIDAKGRPGMNQALREILATMKPDVILVMGAERDYEKETLLAFRECGAISVYLCVDDSWRFESTSRHYAPYFTWVSTRYIGAVEKYRRIGCTRIAFSEAGVPANFCHPASGPKNIDVSFVGMYSKPRGKIVSDLKAMGIDVFACGDGWPNPCSSQEEMARIISRSKISLSLNPPAFYWGWRPIARLFFRRALLGEGGAPYRLDITHFFSNFREWWGKRIRQVKARHFEIAALGVMEITQDAENLRAYYDFGKEVVIYTDTKDLAEKIQYYLSHPEEREAIARAGYERTVRDHTAEKRMENIFRTIGQPL